MALFMGLGDLLGITVALRRLAWAAWSGGRAERAARLYGAAEALCPEAAALDADERETHERVSAAPRRQLGADALAAAHEAGGRLLAEEAAAEASA
jgi:hypothetical protein